MKLLKPDYFDEFKCLGNKCLDHCCKNWRIDIDEETYKFYQSLETPFGNQLKQYITTCDKINYFRLNEKKECPFLNENGLCRVYIELGEENMCLTCKIYPRIVKIRADVIEQTLTLSCPEVSRMIIEANKKIEFNFADNIISNMKEEPVDDILYNMLLSARSCSIEIMQIRFFSLWERQLLVMILSNKIQECMEENNYMEIEKITKEFNDIGILASYIIECLNLRIKNPSSLIFLNNFVRELVLPMDNLAAYMNEIYKRQIVNGDPMGLYNFMVIHEQEFNQYMEDKSIMYENFYVHTLFRYYMNSLEDKNVQKQVIFSNLNYLLIRIYQMISWVDSGKQLTSSNNQLIFSGISKLLEHNSESYNHIFKMFKEQNLTSLAFQAFLLF